MFSSIVRRATLVLAAVAIAGCAGSPAAVGTGAPAPDLQPAAIPTVKIVNYAYGPKTITVKAGTTIKFINKDFTPHTATAMNGSFSSPILSTGKSWKRTFKTVGTFKYTCKFHGFMKGVVKVTN